MSNPKTIAELASKMMACLEHAAPEWKVSWDTDAGGASVGFDAEVLVADGEVIRFSHTIESFVLASYHPAMYPAHAEAIVGRWRDKLRQWKKDNGR